jgi:hypothetical protein
MAEVNPVLKKTMKNLFSISLIIFSILHFNSYGQNPEFEFKFGKASDLSNITTGGNEPESLLKWVNVNTNDDTWSVQDNDVLICSGNPIGVVRSEKQYENFILHVEWKHMEPGGNSGVFVWSNANPGKNRLPDGVEVQMLELDWVNLNKHDGVTPPIAYVHGELFGVGGVETMPDNPRGTRSKSIENRAKGRGEWNTYEVICIDGVVKLAVNGKVVNGLSRSSQKKGYLCLESEGAEIHFRNFKIIELPSGVTSVDQIAPEIN